MYNQHIIVKKPKGLRILLIVLTIIFFLLTLLFIPWFLTDGDSKASVILFGFFTLIFGLLAITQSCFKLEFQGKDIIYVNEFGIKKQFHMSQISTVSIYDPKGMTAYDREQKKLFFIPASAKDFLALLIYLHHQQVNLQFVNPDSIFEVALRQEINPDQDDTEFLGKTYYEEIPSPKAKTLYRINSAIMYILGFIVFLLSVLTIRSSSNFLRCLFITIIFFLIVVRVLFNLLLTEYLRASIRKNGFMLSGSIVAFEAREGKKVTPIYEFKDAKGLHALPAFDKIKVPRQAEASQIGTVRTIYYNPELPSLVLDDDSLTAKASALAVPCIIAGIMMMISVLTCSAAFLIFQNPVEKEADEIRVWTAESYTKSDLTQADVDSDSVQWICSGYAIYTELNNKEHGKIGGVEETNDAVKNPLKVQLSEGWGINDRESAIAQIDSLLSGGHREDYRALVDTMEKDGLFDLTRNELNTELQSNANRYRYLTTYDAYKRYGEKALDGWDYCRVLQVLGDCYQVGYLNLEECLDQSLAIGKKLQEDFKSWDELADSYLYGYQFWKKENPDSTNTETMSRREIYEDLKDTTDGPYAIPFDTALHNTWKDATSSPKKEDADSTEESDTSGVLKPDGDGYYSVKCDSTKSKYKVKALDGFSLSPYSEDDWLKFIKTKDAEVCNTDFTISVREVDGETLDHMEQTATQASEVYSEKTTNIDLPEVEKTTIDGTNISYAHCTYEYEQSKRRVSTIWWSPDDNYLIKVEVLEYTNSKETAFTFEEDTMAKTIFDCVKNE